MNHSDNLRLEIDSKALEIQDLKERLKLTPEERIEAHENSRQLLEDLIKARDDLRARSKEAPNESKCSTIFY